MGVALSKGMLLLDLDCVTIYGGSPRDGLSKEIYLLHPELSTALNRLDWPVVLLTHRARRDADLIRSYLEKHNCQFVDCISSRELFRSALLSFSFVKLFTKGLSKSFALNWLEKKYDITRDQMILIDDRSENLKELINNGMKYGVLAPFELLDESQNEQEVHSFDFHQVIDWIETKLPDSPSHLFEAKAVKKNLTNLPVIGQIDTESPELFESLRRIAKWVRSKVKTLPM